MTSGKRAARPPSVRSMLLRFSEEIWVIPVLVLVFNGSKPARVSSRALSISARVVSMAPSYPIPAEMKNAVRQKVWVALAHASPKGMSATGV